MMRRAQPWLGTLVEVAIADALPEPVLQGAFSAAFAAVARVHGLMSFHEASSDVGRFNSAAVGDTLTVDPHTWDVLALAQHIGALSGGVFNVACAPVLVASGHLPPPPQASMPSYRHQDEVFALEGAGRLRKCAAGWLDLGGIAKGYAVDLAIAALAQAGIGNACVNAGGDLRVLGSRPWPVTIRDPRTLRHQGRQLSLANAAMATSASYFSSRQSPGQPHGALIDGRSAASVDSAASVSVQAPSCAVADALTKVVFASGDPGHPALAACAATAIIIP
jgi:thiamine biosynthesis lipoprotein